MTAVNGQPLHLRFMGDWGIANLHTVCGWLAHGMHYRTPEGSTYVVHTFGQHADLVQPVVDDVVDVGIVTPIATAAMAIKGRGLYSTPSPQLRALAVLPHRDRLVLAIKEEIADELGIESFEDIAAKKPSLRMTAGAPTTPPGFAAEQVLRAYGISMRDIAEWGGEIVDCERPTQAVAYVLDGKADAIFFEGIMRWHPLTDAQPMKFIPVDTAVLHRLEQELDLVPANLEPGDFRGVTETVPTVDFSDWLVLARDDMPDETAALLTQVMVEDRKILEGRYTGTPLSHSPLHYPLDPQRMCATAPVPLHPGSRHYFEEIGCTPDEGGAT